MFHDVNKIYILNKREYIIYKRIKKKKKKYIYRIYKVLKLYFIIIFLKKKKKKKKNNYPNFNMAIFRNYNI